MSELDIINKRVCILVYLEEVSKNSKTVGLQRLK